MKSKALMKYLDNPMRFLTLSMNDFILYVSPFFIGAMFDSIVVIPLSSLIGIRLVKKSIKHLPRFYVIRYLYWVLPTTRFNQALNVNLPFSSKRLWVK